MKIQYDLEVFHKLQNISNTAHTPYPVFEEIMGFRQISLRFMRYFTIFKIFQTSIYKFTIYFLGFLLFLSLYSGKSGVNMDPGTTLAGDDLVAFLICLLFAALSNYCLCLFCSSRNFCLSFFIFFQCPCANQYVF